MTDDGRWMQLLQMPVTALWAIFRMMTMECDGNSDDVLLIVAAVCCKGPPYGVWLLVHSTVG